MVVDCYDTLVSQLHPKVDNAHLLIMFPIFLKSQDYLTLTVGLANPSVKVHLFAFDLFYKDEKEDKRSCSATGFPYELSLFCYM